jgi:hypothetical protein
MPLCLVGALISFIYATPSFCFLLIFRGSCALRGT